MFRLGCSSYCFQTLALQYHALSTFQLSKIPFQRAFTGENIEKSFRSTGIYPLNTQIFPEEEFSLHGHTREQTAVEADLEGNSDVDQSPTTENKEYVTPERLRPVPKIAATKSKKKGKSRIYTDTPEKDRSVELENKRTMKKAAAERKDAAKKMKKRIELDTSDSAESETLSVADTEDSTGSFREASSNYDDLGNNNGLMQFKLCDHDSIKCGDFVMVKFKFKAGGKFYIGKIMEDHAGPTSYTADFLR